MLRKYTPADLVQPEATTKLTLNPAPNSSVLVLPSKKLNTKPQISPKARPLTSMNAGFINAGAIANPRSISSAIPINKRMVTARLLPFISAITLIPENLEMV